jgi:glycosyltransferase involved in cell wall biosynthesis
MATTRQPIPTGTKTKPVPVLMTVRELHYGGIQKDVTKIATRIDRSRFEPHVAAYEVEGIRVEELRQAGVPVVHIPLPSLSPSAALPAAIQVGRYIRKHGISVVHAYDTTAVLMVPVARALRVPAVLTSALGRRELLDSRSHTLVRWTDRLVDTVVVNCEAMRRHLIEDEHVPAERIDLCYNGVLTSEFFPSDTPGIPMLPDASLVIGSVCVLRPEKALTVLQEAFSRIRHLDPGMKLVFVGSGDELARLQQNAIRLEIADANVFVPATQRVADWMRAMDIFALPSSSEAFSNALLEAMACGCCVVGSRVGGTPELIGANEERGLLFKSGDPNDLAAKLSRVIEDVNLRRSLSKAASCFAHDNLSIENAAARTALIYDKVLRRKTRPGWLESQMEDLGALTKESRLQ